MRWALVRSSSTLATVFAVYISQGIQWAKAESKYGREKAIDQSSLLLKKSRESDVSFPPGKPINYMMVNPTRDSILEIGYNRYITVGEIIYRTRE